MATSKRIRRSTWAGILRRLREQSSTRPDDDQTHVTKS